MSHYHPKNHQPGPGEVWFKEWIYTEAERDHVGPMAVYNRVYRGKHPDLQLRRVNRRVIFVKVKA